MSSLFADEVDESFVGYGDPMIGALHQGDKARRALEQELEPLVLAALSNAVQHRRVILQRPTAVTAIGTASRRGFLELAADLNELLPPLLGFGIASGSDRLRIRGGFKSFRFLAHRPHNIKSGSAYIEPSQIVHHAETAGCLRLLILGITCRGGIEHEALHIPLDVWRKWNGRRLRLGSGGWEIKLTASRERRILGLLSFVSGVEGSGHCVERKSLN